MWQHNNLIENPGVPFNSPHFHDWLYGIARNDCNENRIKTTKLNMPATESLKRLTSAATDSRRTYLVLLLAKLEPQLENCLKGCTSGNSKIIKLQIIDVAAGKNLQKQ
uniref:Uncharacterized protein n=1 Tax=Glossina pallidipes TaxID=7398 RepID=A0A1A9ZFT3_GLOPL